MDVKFWSGNVASKTTWEDLGTDGRIVKRIVNERGMRVMVDVAGMHQTERHGSIVLYWEGSGFISPQTNPNILCSVDRVSRYNLCTKQT
jgi:hypothetical protein